MTHCGKEFAISTKKVYMKRIIIIIATLIWGFCCFAQDGPKELTFLNTRFVENASKEELYSKGRDWQHYRDKKDGVYNATLYDVSKPVEYFHIINECPNFGLSPFWGGLDHSRISFIVNIVCKEGMYTAEISHIDAYLNPDLGILYGENGMLYENFYNKKQMKMGKQIVAFLFDYTDTVFKEIYEFMSENR